MSDNNNAYIKVKLEQIDTRIEQLTAELDTLGEKRDAYEAQLVDEPATEPDED